MTFKERATKYHQAHQAHEGPCANDSCTDIRRLTELLQDVRYETCPRCDGQIQKYQKACELCAGTGVVDAKLVIDTLKQTIKLMLEQAPEHPSIAQTRLSQLATVVDPTYRSGHDFVGLLGLASTLHAKAKKLDKLQLFVFHKPECEKLTRVARDVADAPQAAIVRLLACTCGLDKVRR